VSELSPTTVHTPFRVLERRPGWRALNLKELVEYRDLLYFLVRRDITVLYKQTIMGFSWAIIRPVFSMIVFSVVFGRLAKVPSDGIPYPLFSYAALVPWTYFQTAMTSSTTSLVMRSDLISKVYFPRIFIPLTPVLAGLVDFAIALSLVAVLMFYYHYPPTAAIIYFPLLLGVMILTASGIGLWLSALAIQFRDVKFAIQFVAQFMMYAAPVAWPASLIPAKYRIFYGLYPMAGVIEGFRSSLLGKVSMPWDLIGMGTLSAVVLFVTGAFYFRRTERYFADVA